ncbi:beta-1,6-N-acetylglucosaminyltransferase [Modestobacter excelsi]|uniref:beta-1,6-N-acetylglucosaminyltransferase n=1 Tax=Modestobacter excelsi TaxID=2213161 RepID=UPI001C20C945|nr:beta-1,6-N-acetylglucosaminyltransferase [Modestobacter excelsi]
MDGLAFVVLAHRLPQQLIRMVDSLTSAATSFHVHIDRRAPAAVFDQASTVLGPRADVTILPRMDTPWGSLGQVLATVEGIRSARRAGAETVVILSGQDYPIKPTAQIVAFFAANPGRSFIEVRPLPREDWPGRGGLQLYDGRGWSVLGRSVVWKDRRRTSWMPSRPVDLGTWVPHHGSPSFALHSAAADHVVEQLSRRPVRRRFAAVQIPDETAVHTVLANSRLRHQVVSRNLVHADWTANGDHPEVLGPGDLPALAGSDALFARKFDVGVHPDVLDLVDARLRAVGD